MGIFAVANVVAEIESRFDNIKAHVERGLKEADASDQFVDLAATIELINRYAASELLSGTSTATGAVSGITPKGGAVSKSLSDEVIARLKKWVSQIREIVLKLALALHASSWSVSVGFPWNITLFLNFSIPKP